MRISVDRSGSSVSWFGVTNGKLRAVVTVIGSYFVKKHKLTAAAGSDSSTRVGVGGGTRTRTGHLSGLRLGDLSIKNPEANLFTEGSPADPPLAGHIGLELLQEYRVIFDYTRRRMILEPIG